MILNKRAYLIGAKRLLSFLSHFWTMFNRLRKKWGVSTRQFWILFIVFALTGTTTAILTRYITGWLGMNAATFWGWKILLRIGMLLFGYQVILLAYGALFGQWAFFWKYEKKLLQKLGVWGLESEVGKKTIVHGEQSVATSKLFIDNRITRNPKPETRNRNRESSIVSHQSDQLQTKQIAIFASGAGSNAAKIIDSLKDHPTIRVSLIVCNKSGAGVLDIASANHIPILLIEKERFFRGDAYLPELSRYGINFIVLAGFLWKIPPALISAYPQKIINIHPALLPKYGGKGMYGMKVHEAVINAAEKESGITIHYVNEFFDDGEPVFQAVCTLADNETPESLAQKIHALEHKHFPEVIMKLLS
jgi:formyltetrahydrofolate-dependent phosphoribosylglycinamide formyltransferase